MKLKYALAALGLAAALFAQQPAAHGIVAANMDASVKPGDDFYAYANGSWMKRAEIAADKSVAGVDQVLADLADKRVSDLIEEAAKSNAPAGSGARKIADLYNSYMDEAGIEAKGLAPVKPYLDAIAAIQNKKALARALGESLRADVDVLNATNFETPNLFGFWAEPGFNDVEHYAGYLLQGGLQLPDREYYLADNEKMRDIRTKYQAHVAAMFKLAGFSDPEKRAEAVFKLEHDIAEKHWKVEETEDVHRGNNYWKRGEFASKAPGLDWAEYFKAAGLEKAPGLYVWQPSAFTGEAALVGSAPLDAWKDWLAIRMLDTYGGVLPKAFVEERFNFYSKTLSGVPQMRPRWQRGVGLVNGLLGEEVGRIYAQKYFPPEAKAQVQAMVTNIVEAFRKRIDALAWMDPATKAEAKAKLDTLYVGVGYPDQWRDYSGYEVRPDDAFGNVRRGALFEYRHSLALLGKPLNRKDWCMTPQTVNAVNLPMHNSLNFPAAILQPPHFDPQAPAAANYGAIGATIGHEISHTFDTSGADFDSKGRLRNWWKKADFDHFEQATAALAAQYDQYKPFPDLALNGKQTLGENIADVAGLSAAWDAYQASLAGKPAPAQDGFSGAQQFFIAFGQSWQTKMREALVRRLVATDGHSPAEYRVATVRNLDAWYSAFNVTPGDKLYLAPKDRIPVW